VRLMASANSVIIWGEENHRSFAKLRERVPKSARRGETKVPT
jgi:hypothetical protein